MEVSKTRGEKEKLSFSQNPSQTTSRPGNQTAQLSAVGTIYDCGTEVGGAAWWQMQSV